MGRDGVSLSGVVNRRNKVLARSSGKVGVANEALKAEGRKTLAGKLSFAMCFWNNVNNVFCGVGMGSFESGPNGMKVLLVVFFSMCVFGMLIFIM